MGSIQLGILSDVKGRIGPVVGSNFRGKNVLRARPKKSTKEPTLNQLEQRMRFSMAVKFVSAMKPVINNFYGNDSGLKSKLNQCVSYHAKEAITGDYPDLEIDYSKVIFTKGDLENSNAQMTNTNLNKVDITWTDNDGTGFSKSSDQAIIVLYNANKNRFIWQISNVMRSVETIQIDIPTAYLGDEIHGWLSFRSENQTMAATSNYLGSLTLS